MTAGVAVVCEGVAARLAGFSDDMMAALERPDATGISDAVDP